MEMTGIWREAACAATLALLPMLLEPSNWQEPAVPAAHRAMRESPSTYGLLPVPTHDGVLPAIDDLAANMWQARQRIKRFSGWQEADHRLARELVSSLLTPGIAGGPNKYAILRDDLANISGEVRQQAWFINNQRLTEWFACIQEQDSLLHPAQLYEVYNQLAELPDDPTEFARKLAMGSRPRWRHLLKKYCDIEAALASLPRVEVPVAVADLYQDLDSYDGVAEGGLRDKGAAVRLLLLCKLYALMQPR